MIPSSKYFPGTMQERAAWYANFSTQATDSGVDYGLSTAEVTQIEKDNLVMQFLAQSAVKLDAYNEAVRNFRKIITEGDIGDPTPSFPSDLAFTLPLGALTGIFERLDDAAKRIRASAEYTTEVGALYGILPSSSSNVLPPDAKPKIEVSVLPGNQISVKFVRGASDGVRIETAVDKGDFASQGSYFKSPAVIDVPQNTDNLPRSVQVKARYLDGNSPMGEYSDIAVVQTIP